LELVDQARIHGLQTLGMAGHVASQEAQELAEYWVVCLKAFEAWRARQHDFAAGADAVADLVALAEPQGAPIGTSTVTPCRRGATYSCAPYSRIRTSCCHVADRGHCPLGDVGLRPRPGIAKQQAAGSRPCTIRAHLDKTNPPGHLYRPEPL
jgi:hypothetical protein